MLQKVSFLPGINKQVTPTGGEAQWVDCDNVRFEYQLPEKIGGWKQLGADNVTGAARGLHQFTNSAGQVFYYRNKQRNFICVLRRCVL